MKHTSMSMAKTAFAVLVCSLAGATGAFASMESTATLANPLDNAAGSARSMGMGSAFVGVADDSTALLTNPAGLGGLPVMHLALHHNSWLAGMVQETAVAVAPTGDLGVIGVSLNYVTYGTFTGFDANGAQTADYSANRYGVGLGWGKVIVPGLSAGVSAKESVQSIAGKSHSAFSVDVGGLWAPVSQVQFGLVYANIGTSVAGYSLASALRAGASYRMELAPTNRLLLAAGAAWEPNGVSRLQFGGEDIIGSMVAVRLGYQASLEDNLITGVTGMSAGIGLLYRGFNLDYAYLPFGDLGTTHRISLGFRFGGNQ